MEFITKSAQETSKLGGKIIVDLVSQNKGKTIVLALSGDLGSGKTTFVQGMGKALGIKRIISPTFIISRVYDISFGGYKKFIHMDCYRLENVKSSKDDVIICELIENIAIPSNIIVIEWAERILRLIPVHVARVFFKDLGQTKRAITVR